MPTDEPGSTAMPDASSSAFAQLPPACQAEIARFVAKLRRRQIQSSQDVARKTLEIMRLLVATLLVKDVKTLIAQIKRAGAGLVVAQPHEQLVIGNMVRRVLAIVREETADEGKGAAGVGGEVGGPSLLRLLDAPDAVEGRKLPKDLKGSIIEVINELIEELSSVSSHIAEQAIEHIHANEVILTHGRDPTVEAFLKAAHKKRAFEVIVAETSPGGEGQLTAVALAEAGISTTLIADAAVFAMMARVNKVIIGASAVMANGGLVGTAGAHLIALAAHHASVPLVACAGMYKLSPLFPSGTEQFNVLGSPQPMVKYDEGGVQGVHVPNPGFDYVPPELVALLVTNIGGNHASYIYRLVAEYYSQEDHDLESE